MFNYNECCKDVHTSLKEAGYCSFVVGMERYNKWFVEYSYRSVEYGLNHKFRGCHIFGKFAWHYYLKKNWNTVFYKSLIYELIHFDDRHDMHIHLRKIFDLFVTKTKLSRFTYITLIIYKTFLKFIIVKKKNKKNVV